jgi:hypothetical protein
MVGGRWQFPVEAVGKTSVYEADYVYNLVLGPIITSTTSSTTDTTSSSIASSSTSTDKTGQELRQESMRGVSVVVSGVECITLAHGITDDPVAAHAFFGTDKVLHSLLSLDSSLDSVNGSGYGYNEGLVTIDGVSEICRDAKTGLVCGYSRK